MDIHLSHALHNVIGWLRISSHQLEIEVESYACTPVEERICQLCHQGMEYAEHYFATTIFYDISDIPMPLLTKALAYYTRLWNRANGALGMFLLELKRHREKLKENNTTIQAHQQ